MGQRRRRRRQELLADGRDRPVRAVQRDPLRPRRTPERGSGLHPGPLGAVPALARDLESRVHGVRPAARRSPAAAVHERRYRAGPGASGKRPPAGPDELRHGSLRADPRHRPPADGPRPGPVRSGTIQLPGHRRPLAGGDVPRRRRRPAVERGPRLRPPPNPSAGRPARPVARAARAVSRRGGRDRHLDHGRCVSAPARAARRDPRRDRPGRGSVRPDA